MPPLCRLVESVSHGVVVSGIRTYLEGVRRELQQENGAPDLPAVESLAESIASWIKAEDASTLRPVINATGILLHTGLGRAPLADAAISAINAIASGYASVEVDLDSGHRSQRVLAVESLLKELTGAEAAAVVNNNAAATMLTLTALAKDREVIVSRGQLIEIGGSFRLPDVMTSSGAELREVGTTNKTRVGDYEDAINERTAALMQVHTSNYVVVGFTESATLAELVAVGAKHQLPVIDDIGSGALIDFEPYGVKGEPVASESIAAGADVVLFSGDKLVGGPQCGIIVGREHSVQRIAKHPMMRALRVDKITLAALAATLRLYRDVAKAQQQLPLLVMLSATEESLKNRAQALSHQLASAPAVAQSQPVEDHCFLGGGSVPTQQFPTWCVALTPATGTLDQLAKSLRTGNPSVFGRVQNDRLLLDLRSVLPHQDEQLVRAVSSCATEA